MLVTMTIAYVLPAIYQRVPIVGPVITAPDHCYQDHTPQVRSVWAVTAGRDWAALQPVLPFCARCTTVEVQPCPQSRTAAPQLMLSSYMLGGSLRTGCARSATIFAVAAGRR